MADLQSGRKTQKRRVKQMLPQHGGVLAGVTRWHIPQRPRPLKSWPRNGICYRPRFKRRSWRFFTRHKKPNSSPASF